MKSVWKKIANNIDIYKSYPRIVAETGSLFHHNLLITNNEQEAKISYLHIQAHTLMLWLLVIFSTLSLFSRILVAMIRGAFEYSGQKCSAASRAYVPASIWPNVKDRLISQVQYLSFERWNHISKDERSEDGGSWRGGNVSQCSDSQEILWQSQRIHRLCQVLFFLLPF